MPLKNNAGVQSVRHSVAHTTIKATAEKERQYNTAMPALGQGNAIQRFSPSSRDEIVMTVNKDRSVN